MLGKLNAKRIAHGYRQVRNHVAMGYSQAVKAGTMLSDAVDVAYRIHGALQDSGVYSQVPQAQKAIGSGFKGFGEAKKKVTDRHDQVLNTLSRVKARAPEVKALLS